MKTKKTSDELPLRVYTPELAMKHPLALIKASYLDLLKGRELAWRLFVRDLSAQYRQTLFGYVWAFLPPLVSSATFIFLQSQGIVNIKGTGIPYPAFALIGTLLWQTFVEAIQSPLGSVQAAKPMLAKVNFPREAILLAGAYMVCFNLLIRMVLLAGVLVVWRIQPGSSILLFPVALLGLLLSGYAIGLLLIPIGSLYGDVSRSIPIAAQFWMLLTPVVYPASASGLTGTLTVLNPISSLILTARDSLTNQPIDHIFSTIVVSLIAAVVCLVGLSTFRIIMPHLIERMGG